jgi:hypothetical protein
MSTADNLASDEFIYNDLDRVGHEAAVTYFKVLPKHLSRKT